ncbi:MAG TPA: hypothetical protein PLN56_10685 [Methanoregulaceae archaeon]|nr:hypothetical protein [Sedimentisphaerales bacterium]HPD11444.1 hypothetical protein [Methanoregulaceae archaeon]
MISDKGCIIAQYQIVLEDGLLVIFEIDKNEQQTLKGHLELDAQPVNVITGDGVTLLGLTINNKPNYLLILDTISIDVIMKTKTIRIAISIPNMLIGMEIGRIKFDDISLGKLIAIAEMNDTIYQKSLSLNDRTNNLPHHPSSESK